MSFAVVGTGLAVGVGGAVAGNILAPDQPAAPDFTGSAEAKAAADLEAARSATEANRYDQFTPLGSQEWTNLGYDYFDEDAYNTAMDEYTKNLSHYSTMGTLPGVGSLGTAAAAEAGPSLFQAPTKEQFTTRKDQDKWRSDVNLSPEVQGLFDKGLMMQDISADIGLTAGEQIKSTFADPFELDDFEGYREDVYDAMLERLETDINRDWESQQAKLYAGGIGSDTEAYGRDEERKSRSLNDARLQAYQAATQQALNERGQTVKEALLQRNQPLNEYNAWRTGAQVDLPQFAPGGQQQTTAGPDYLGSAMEQGQYDLAGYNADVMGQNAMMSGLFSLGAGGLAGGYF